MTSIGQTTTFMTKMKNDLISNKGLAETTAVGYIANLTRLAGKPFANLAWLKTEATKKLVAEKLADKSDSTAINYLASIVAVLSVVSNGGGAHLYKKAYDYWQDLLDEKSGIKKEKEKANENVKTKKQEDSWINWDEMKAVYQTIKGKVDEFKNEKSITNKQYSTLLDYLILSLYMLQENGPRRNNDFLQMKLIPRGCKPAERDNKLYNYCDMKEKEFVYNNYKTAKTYKQQIEPISEPLMDVLTLWVKYHPILSSSREKCPIEYLFPRRIRTEGSQKDEKDLPLNFITLRLNKIFGGKRISSSMIRHIYLTSMLGPEVEALTKAQMELKNKGSKLAKGMGHSTEMQKSYVVFDKPAEAGTFGV